MLPRSTMWRLECSEPVTALLIEATTALLPAAGQGHGRPARDLRPGDARRRRPSTRPSRPSRTRRPGGSRSSAAARSRPSPTPSTRWTRSAGRAIWRRCGSTSRDIRPLMSHRYHLPPSAHTTFVGNRFVVCTFVPRPFESDPDALKVPFFHNNDDYDEVIFYHAGDFFSRDNIHPGMVTFHPCGFTHGPHPKALKNMLRAEEAGHRRICVMIDTRDALELGCRRPASSGRITSTPGRATARAEAEMKLASLKEGEPRRHLDRGQPGPDPGRPRGFGHDPAAGAGGLAELRSEAGGGVRPGRGRRRARGCPLRSGGLRGAPAARLPVGRRLGLRQPRRAGPQGARRRDARELLERSR